MTRRLHFCGRAVVIAVALRSLKLANAASCYYPNGKLTTAEQPCSSDEGSACCPDKWQCLDNGLCYYPPDNLYGRYSCTDKNWDSPHCPSNICSYNMTAYGGEGIPQCSNHGNQWCCDADRVHRDCCNDNSVPFWDLPKGKAYATVGSGSTPSSAPTLNTFIGPASPEDTGKAGNAPSQSKGSFTSAKPTSAPSSKTSAKSSSSLSSETDDSSSSADATKNSDESSTRSDETSSTTEVSTTVMSTSLQTSVTSGAGGISTIILTTSVPIPTTFPSNTDPSQTSKKKSKTPLIVGLAVGIPLGLAILALLFLLYRRHNKSAGGAKHSDSSSPHSPDPPYTGPGAEAEFVGGYTKPGYSAYAANAAELPSQSVGPERPVSMVPGKAELESGGAFAPGHNAHAPHLVGVGGGNGSLHTPQSSWGSAPPGYSPGRDPATGAAGNENAAELPANGNANATTAGGRYVPYRPPQQPPQMQQQAPLPGIAELPTLRTPPA